MGFRSSLGNFIKPGFNPLATPTTSTFASLMAWGNNGSGSLGNGTTVSTSSPVQVGSDITWTYLSKGASSCLVVKTDGTLWAWGQNDYGQLGINSTTNYSSPTQVGALTTWTKCFSGWQTSFAIKSDGTLWGFGKNADNQLGNGASSNISSPVQIGSATWSQISPNRWTTLGIQTDGTLWYWGTNQGAFGDGSSSGSASTPQKLGLLQNWSSVTHNDRYSFALALKTNGTLWAWGKNNKGQLGRGNTTPVYSPIQVGSETDWTVAMADLAADSSAGNNSIAVRGGKLFTWGYNNYGQLGLNNAYTYTSPKQVGALTTWSNQILTNQGKSMAIKTDGTLWVWGQGSNGRLGLGNTTAYSSPKQVGSDTLWTKLGGGGSNTLAIG